MINKQDFLKICAHFRDVRKKTGLANDAGIDLIEITDPLYGATNILGESIFGKDEWGAVIDWVWEGGTVGFTIRKIN